MKQIITTIKEITNSPTLCLNPLQYLKECQKCDIFKKRMETYNGDPLKTVHKLECKPRIKKEILQEMEDLAKKKIILKRIQQTFGTKEKMIYE